MKKEERRRGKKGGREGGKKIDILGKEREGKLLHSNSFMTH